MIKQAMISYEQKRTARRAVRRMTGPPLAAMLTATLAACASIALAGCGGFRVDSSSARPASAALHGRMLGGQQPVTGASVQLYAAGTAGYGSAASTLLTTPVSTNSSGSFDITSDYVCPSASTQVYLVGVGGNSGSGNNPNLALMAPLGACGNLSSASFISLNEITTVAGVWALAPFMSGYANVGTSASNVQGLVNAFGSVSKLASIAQGTAPGNTLPAGATVPVREINALANVLAACTNTTGGAAGAGNACGFLFTNATPPGGKAPTDLIGAALNIARNPGLNVLNLYELATPTSPFQPTLASVPNDWTISITYGGNGLNAPSSAAVDASGNLWVANQAGNSVTVLTAAGAPLAGSPFTGGGLSGPSAIAIDASGNAWIADKTGSQVTALSSTGAPLAGSPFAGGGLNQPGGIAIDGQGMIWIANSGNSSVTELNASGAVVSGANGFTGAGISAPVAIAINPR